MIGLYLNIPEKCSCCGVADGTVRAWGCDKCVEIWYDCGLVVRSEIGRYCNHARKNGYWPFDTFKQMPEAEFNSVVLQKKDVVTKE